MLWALRLQDHVALNFVVTVTASGGTLTGTVVLSEEDAGHIASVLSVSVMPASLAVPGFARTQNLAFTRFFEFSGLVVRVPMCVLCLHACTRMHLCEVCLCMCAIPVICFHMNTCMCS